MKKENSAIKYGLIGAIVLVAFGIIIQLIALSYLESAASNPGKFTLGKALLIGICSLVIVAGIFIYCIVKSIKEYRKKDPEYTYRKLVAQGLLVTLILVVVSSGLSYLYNNVITPETREKTLELTKQVYQNLSIPDDQKEKMLEGLENKNPVRELLTSLGLTLLLGMIISLVSAMVMNKRNTFNNPNQMR